MIPQKNKTDRYQRQTILKGFGTAAQEKLGGAKILVVGAGGLGCPALLYLTAAGIGSIGIIDFDKVSITNLHRQVLYTMEDLGQFKTEAAARRLKSLNDEITIQTYTLQLTAYNCIGLVSAYDLVIDGTDNFSTRYMLSDACSLLNKPLIYGAVFQFEGQVAIFHGRNYRDIFPQPPAPGEVPDCAEAGVLGIVPGIIGTLQASEAIKLVTGIGEPLLNKLLTYDILNNQILEIGIMPNPAAANMMPASVEAFIQLDYDLFCGIKFSALEISVLEFEAMKNLPDLLLIDVREPGEPAANLGMPHQQHPLPLLKNQLHQFNAETVVFFCATGKRSLQAAVWLKESNSRVKNVYSLKGGLAGYHSAITEKNGDEKT